MIKRVLLLFVTAIAFCGYAAAQDIDKRFAEFQFQKAKLNEGKMSVLVEKFVEGEGKNSNYSLRILQRLVYGTNGLKRRLDGITCSVVGESDLSKFECEAQLIHENEGWYVHEYPYPVQNQELLGIKHFEVKEGVIDTLCESRWKHPFDISTTQGGGMLSNTDSKVTTMMYTTIEEETLKDGRTRFVAVNNRGGVFHMTFNQEEHWFMEQIEFLNKPLTLEEEIESARNPNRKRPVITKEMLKDYHVYASNRTQWKEVTKNRWVPWVTQISSDEGGVEEDFEIRFRDWKFGDDVDTTLLDEANFTSEKIAASIDFKAIRDLFDEEK